MIRNPTWLHDARFRLWRISDRLKGELGREPTAEEVRLHVPDMQEWVFRTAIVPEPEIAPLQFGEKSVYESDATDEMMVAQWKPGEVETSVVMESHMRRLPEQERQALLLHHVEGFSIREVANLMGTTPKRVTSLLDKGRKTIRFSLLNDGLTENDLLNS